MVVHIKPCYVHAMDSMDNVLTTTEKLENRFWYSLQPFQLGCEVSPCLWYKRLENLEVERVTWKKVQGFMRVRNKNFMTPLITLKISADSWFRDALYAKSYVVNNFCCPGMDCKIGYEVPKMQFEGARWQKCQLFQSQHGSKCVTFTRVRCT